MGVVTRNDLKRWIQNGIGDGNEYMMVLSDDFSYEYYPVYIKNRIELHKKLEEVRGENMASVKEIYNYKKPLEPQIESNHAWEV